MGEEHPPGERSLQRLLDRITVLSLVRRHTAS
jgi:hypothetical protein